MKKIFRFVGIGTVLAAMFALGAVAAFAQDPCTDVDVQNAKYQEVLANYKSQDPVVLQKAIDSAKEFLEKYGSCEIPKPQVDWMKPKVPIWETRVAEIIKRQEYDKLLAKFNKGYTSSNWDDVYSSGKDIIGNSLTEDPTKLDVSIVLAFTGFDQATKKNNKYNDDAISYAKSALQKMNSGVVSKVYGVAFPTSNITFGSKANAVGWMNLTIGFISSNGKDDKKGALSYLYQASLNGPETSVNPIVYELIGKYFLSDAIQLTEELKKLAADVHDTDAEDVSAKKQADIKAKKALINGTAERAMDAYSRAYKFAKTDAASKPYKDSLYQKIQQLYTVRYLKTDGIDGYISSTTAKPFVDPTTPVTPIADAEPEKTTTSTSPATTPTKPAGAKPGATSGVTKASTAIETAKKEPNETAVAAKTKLAVKTPAVVKKGHR